MGKSQGGVQRPFIGIKFDCCGVYTRLYREPEATEYRGRCPKCYREVVVRVDPVNGKASKFLKAL